MTSRSFILRAIGLVAATLCGVAGAQAQSPGQRHKAEPQRLSINLVGERGLEGVRQSARAVASNESEKGAAIAGAPRAVRVVVPSPYSR